MISCPTVNKPEIRAHYDFATLFYWLFWGPHIHHGLWEGDESSAVAQLRLVDTVAQRAGITGGERVLDVGCGMGGSSIYLARRFGCQVTGVTISPVQRSWGAVTATLKGVGRRVEFRSADAETIELPSDSYDVVWSVECVEHLFDKQAFLRRAANWVPPGGQVAFCTWLAGERDDLQTQNEVVQVCHDFLCPSLGKMEDYITWIQAAGLELVSAEDWTPQIHQTWTICRERTQRRWLRWLATRLGPAYVNFLDGFVRIGEAFRSGAMRYGCFVARRPE